MRFVDAFSGRPWYSPPSPCVDTQTLIDHFDEPICRVLEIGAQDESVEFSRVIADAGFTPSEELATPADTFGAARAERLVVVERGEGVGHLDRRALGQAACHDTCQRLKIGSH